MHDIQECDNNFQLKKYCVGFFGFSSIQNCIAALRCLAYGAPADSLDDYLRMSESTDIEATYTFLQGCEYSVWTELSETNKC